MEKIPYHGWQNACKISNGTVEVIVTADVGPRVISYGFVNGPNHFKEFEEQLGKTGGDQWRSYGGSRLWVAPEDDRTYFPDNVPVKVVEEGSVVKFTAPVELHPLATYLEKEIDVELAADGTEVTINTRITNHGSERTFLSPWFITVMRSGGRAILPFPPKAPWGPDTLPPVGSLSLWSYTDFSDSRWVLGQKYLQLQQQTEPTGKFSAQKIGIHNPAGWGACYNDGELFVKRSKFEASADYPDYQSNFEVYTDPSFLELESLGPNVYLEPGASVHYSEKWWLFKGVAAGNDDAWVDQAVMPLVETTRF